MALVFGLAVAVSAAAPAVVRMDKDTYFIQKRSAQIGFGPPAKVKAEVLRTANEFCESKGMALEIVELKEVNSGFARPASVALRFRCVPKQVTQPGSEKTGPAPTAQDDSVERRLAKLRSLFERGVITEEEYQKQRAEIIKAL